MGGGGVKNVQNSVHMVYGCPLLRKIDKSCPKIKGYLINYVFHAVDMLLKFSKPIENEALQMAVAASANVT